MKVIKLINILVVDDSKMNLELAEKIITKHMRDVRVETVIHPKEAIDQLSRQEFQIVILDIVMPDINGIEVLKWIKNQDFLKRTKVIMFTSLDDSSLLAEAFTIGAYDYIRKPFEKNEFIARIRHAINEYEYLNLVDQNVKKITEKNQELKALNEKLKKTQTDLVQSERVAGVGYLAAGISHELNNPLSFIQSNVSVLMNTTDILFSSYEEVKKLTAPDQNEKIDLLEKNTNYTYLKEEMPELYEDILNGINRMTEIINALRNFSDIDAIHEAEEVSLVDTMENMKALLLNRLRDKIYIEFNMEIESNVKANRGDIGLSFFNILQNAIEAIEAKEENLGGSIIINVSEDDTCIFVEIKDDGIGMSEKVLGLSLNPFYTTKDIGDGRGLGLSIAYNCFVHILKGTMKIDSKENIGTTVHIVLPKYS
jgi:signal transduction histidine kinase